ncbi:hypothetical protein BH09BAC5_BH09BAC5_26150 [soil metagenome]
MRYILFLFFIVPSLILKGQNTPVIGSMLKKSGNVLRVRVVEELPDKNVAGPVLVEVVEVYKSKTFHVGDRIAVRMQPFSITDDSAKVNHLSKGNELIVFLKKEDPKTYNRSGQLFPYYDLYDEWCGWIFFNERLGEMLKKNK